MSRFRGEQDSTAVLDAAQQWRTRCLIEGGSVFGDEPLWRLEHIEALEQYFVNNLDMGEGDFFEKLEAQLAPTQPEVKKLAKILPKPIHFKELNSAFLAQTDVIKSTPYAINSIQYISIYLFST